MYKDLDNVSSLISAAYQYCAQSFILGGRGNTASQRAHREVTPIVAVGKVPVSLGRECQQ